MNIILILKGLWIGSTMTIPGVSGGTMAVVTGIYEELIKSINGLRKEPKEHLPFLIKFALSALVGFILFAGFVTYLLENIHTGTYIRFLFAGNAGPALNHRKLRQHKTLFSTFINRQNYTFFAFFHSMHGFESFMK